MSKQKSVSVTAFDNQRPIPFAERKPESKGGKATYKTATAAAHAAEAARDEARIHLTNCEESAKEAKAWAGKAAVGRSGLLCSLLALLELALLLMMNASVCLLINWLCG